MKKLLLVIILISISVTACPGQNLRLIWDAHPSYDSLGVAQYILYKWQGDSSQWQAWQLSDMDSIGTLRHVQNVISYEFRTYFDPQKIIRGGVCAEDSLGRRSDIALSDFYFHPKEIEKIRISK